MEELLNRWIKLLKESGKDTKGQVLEEMQKSLELKKAIEILVNGVDLLIEAIEYIINHPELIEKLQEKKEVKK